jgi:hypothetical protein
MMMATFQRIGVTAQNENVGQMVCPQYSAADSSMMMHSEASLIRAFTDSDLVTLFHT